jgi:hypothetical protein
MALDLTDNPATNAAQNVLGKKYGPLPFWGWLIIVGGTVFAVKKYTSKRNATEDAIDADASQTSASGGLTSRPLVTPGANGTLYSGGSVSTGGGGTSTIGGVVDTNQSWLNRALSILGQSGQYPDTYRVQTALQRYISGLVVTDPTDKAIISDALLRAGGPPQPPTSGSGSGFNTDMEGNYLPDNTIIRFIQGRKLPGAPDVNGGIYAQYSDGTIKWMRDPTELYNVARTSGNWNLFRDDRVVVAELPSADPIWGRAVDGPGISESQLYSNKTNQPISYNYS